MDITLTVEGFHPAESYYQKDNLDRDSWFYVTQIDYDKLIEQYSFNDLFKAFDRTQLKLLDTEYT